MCRTLRLRSKLAAPSVAVLAPGAAEGVLFRCGLRRCTRIGKMLPPEPLSRPTT